MDYASFCETVEQRREDYARGLLSERKFRDFLSRNGWDKWWIDREVQDIDDRTRRHPLANKVYS